MNKKGFTLIEVIAVVVILGIIMFIAVPNISSYILGSKKDTYINDAKRFVDGAKNFVSTKGIPINKTNITYYIPKECLPIDKQESSPYGKWDKVYVAVTYDNRVYNYYFTSIDSEKMGIELTYSENLKTDRIKNIEDITTVISIGKDEIGNCTRDKIRVINESCNIADSILIDNVTNCIDEKSSYN